MRQSRRNCRGETLAETLVSLAVIGCAVTLLASLMGAAGRIHMETRTRDQAFLEEASEAETRQGPEQGRGTLEVLDTATGDVLQRLDVILYGGSNLVSFQAADGEGGP